MFVSYFALIDGLRKAPRSFAALTYHSQIVYKFIPRDGRPRLVKFRLIPQECQKSAVDQVVDNWFESGLLSSEDQRDPWQNDRNLYDNRPPKYLRTEFLKRLEKSSVHYLLQMQMADLEDLYWNPQQVSQVDLFDI